jgi:dihydropteroate synthase
MAGIWVEPLGLLQGRAAALAIAADVALPLGGGAAAFTMVRIIAPDAPAAPMALADVPPGWQAQVLALTQPVPGFAGLPTPAELGRPLVMGIVNVTPDSFSDGGRHFDPRVAIEAGHAMLEAGADLLDVGGESTRPGAEPVTPEEEIARILPVLRELAKAATVSVDTRNAATMRAALEAGAEIVNDVTALRHDPEAARVVADAECGLVLMHMKGTDPRSMQQDIRYDDVAVEVADFLARRLRGGGGHPAVADRARSRHRLRQAHAAEFGTDRTPAAAGGARLPGVVRRVPQALHWRIVRGGAGGGSRGRQRRGGHRGGAAWGGDPARA